MKKVSTKKLKNIYNFIMHDIKSAIIVAVLSLVLTIPLSINFYYGYFDVIAATEQEYNVLEQYLYEIEENPEGLFEIPLEYNLVQHSNGNKSVEITDRENGLSVTFEYTKDFKIISTSRKDLYLPLAFLFVFAALFFVDFFFSFFIISLIVCWILKGIIKRRETNEFTTLKT